MFVRRLVALVCLIIGAAASCLPVRAAGEAGAGTVIVIPIHGTIDEGMAHLVERAVADAKTSGARAIVLDVNTYGGLVAAGTDIRDALIGSSVPVDAYVTRAWSAGALVALSAHRIVMAPGSSIGAAQPIPKTDKTVSALRSEFAATADRYHRNARLASAMVDGNVDAPAYKAPGAILTLTGEQAQTTGIAEAVASESDAYRRFGLASAVRAPASYTFAEQVARFLTNPDVSGFLLSIGFLGLLIELQTLHGIAGAIGVLALGLFFGTHVYAGFSNVFVVALAIVGVLLILVELHVLPGHGVAGIAGVVALGAAVLLAFGLPFLFGGLQAMGLAILISAFAFWLLQRWMPDNAFMRRLVFTGAQGPQYVASLDHRALLGRSGVALSFLRPAGIATFDQERVDVLTEGDFVPAGTPVRVTRVEGARIFVAPDDERSIPA